MTDRVLAQRGTGSPFLLEWGIRLSGRLTPVLWFVVIVMKEYLEQRKLCDERFSRAIDNKWKIGMLGWCPS